MYNFRVCYLNFFYAFMLMWLLGVIIFESVLCSTLDIHRIVLKTHHRKYRDRDNHKYYPDNRQKRKPIGHAHNQDEWPSESKIAHHYYNYRVNHKYENNHHQEHGKSKNYTTVKSPSVFNTPDLVEFTTIQSEKLPILIPTIKTSLKNYYPLNNSLASYNAIAPKWQNTNFSGRVRQLREKETSRNITKGYEVYEEIIGDLSPPPQHTLIGNTVHDLPVINTTFPTVIQIGEENHVKGNASYYSENKNKTYGTRTKSRRNRGHVKFD